MLPIALNPYFDEVLRRHLARQAAARGLHLEDLEAAFSRESDALAYLRECGKAAYEAYEEDACAEVDYVGWIVVPVERAPRPRLRL